MRTVSRVRAFTVVLTAGLLCAAPSARAQSAQTPTDQPAPTPLVVEKIDTTWLFVPDARVADLDGRTGSLAGGYIGRITDRTFVVGAGGYWLTNRDDDFKLAYGGAVIEWLARSNHKIGFGVRALIGGGSATLPRTLGDIVNIDRRDFRVERPVRFGRGLDPGPRIAVRDDFFIAEPQLNLLLNLSRRYRVSFGVGYRAIGAAPALGDQLQGVSGSVALQIGGGR
ncbi:MAG TPA: hypothetical protein PLH72_03730 [Vicinamibacterales bacterium]|nr:hypothetical protein [Vicinamibacterales bacterium]